MTYWIEDIGLVEIRVKLAREASVKIEDVLEKSLDNKVETT